MTGMEDGPVFIPPPRPPEPIEKRPHPWTFKVSIAALIIAFGSAAFTFWQALEARGARTAAERSAKAAERSAAAAEATVKFEQQANLSLVEYKAERSPAGVVRFALNIGNVGKGEASILGRDMYAALDGRIIERTTQPEQAAKSSHSGMTCMRHSLLKPS